MKSFKEIITNKWFRLIIWNITLLFTTCVYYGWQQYSLMLFKSGAYDWLCDPDAVSDTEFLCEAQYSAVSNLYTFASSLEFCGGLISGIVFDSFGPRICATLGSLMFYLGYLLNANSTQTVNMYVIGHIISGFSVNFVAFPSFILGEIWDGHQQLVIALVLGMQTGATIVAPILLEIMRAAGSTYKVVMMFYLLFCLPFTVLYCISLPRSRKAVRAEIKALRLEHSSSFSTSNGDSIITNGKDFWKAFVRYAFTIDIFIFILWYVAQIMSNNAYNTGLRSFAGDKVAYYVGWIMWGQGPLGIFIGWFNDKTRTLYICIAISILNAIIYALTYIPNDGIQYLGSTIFVISNSYIYTTKYNYVQELFDEAHFGKLAGGIGFVAGLMQFFNILIENASPTLDVLMGAWIGVSLFSIMFILFLTYRQWKGISYKEVKGENISVSATSETSNSPESSGPSITV